jgi:dTDP-4-dehydrorhamnose reductase
MPPDDGIGNGTMWLISGGDGQLGRCLGERLTALGVAHHRAARSELDVTDPVTVHRELARWTPTVVVNAAGWTAVDDAETHREAAFSVNHLGARNLAVTAREHGAMLIHVSTDYVFDGRDRCVRDEQSPTSAISVYGESKLAGEKAVLEEHPDGSRVVRTAWLYSRHGRNFARTMVRHALADHSVKVVDDQFGQPTSAPDLAAHLVELVDSRVPPGTYHGTNSGVATWFDLACEIYRLCGRDPERVTACTTAQYPALAPRPAYSVLGHRRTVEAGVAEMRDWMSALEATLPDVIAAVRGETT